MESQTIIYGPFRLVVGNGIKATVHLLGIRVDDVTEEFWPTVKEASLANPLLGFLFQDLDQALVPIAADAIMHTSKGKAALAVPGKVYLLCILAMSQWMYWMWCSGGRN